MCCKSFLCQSLGLEGPYRDINNSIVREQPWENQSVLLFPQLQLQYQLAQFSWRFYAK